MNDPDNFNDDAHPKATEITVDRPYGEWGQCISNAKTRGERCRGYAKGPHGKCRHHGGDTPTQDENPNVGAGAAEPGEARAEQHALKADRKKWYDRQDDETQAGITQLHAHWVEQANNPQGASAILWDAAVDEFRLGQADNHIDDEGLIVEDTVGWDEETNEPQTSRQENPALLPKDRIRRVNLRTLKETGVIESADDRIAGAMEGGFDIDVSIGDETKDILRETLQQHYRRQN